MQRLPFQIKNIVAFSIKFKNYLIQRYGVGCTLRCRSVMTHTDTAFTSAYKGPPSQQSTSTMHPYHKLMLILLLAGGGQTAHGAKIINGHPVPDNVMLYMASLQNDSGHMCGGFLVKDNFVLTAAHCDKVLSVVLGTHHLNSASNDMRYNVLKKCKHPDYVNAASGNDIMLLKLSRTAQGAKVKVIDLPESPVTSLADKTCEVAGWGYEVSQGKPVNDLKKTSVKIFSEDECERRLNKAFPHNTICAGGANTSKGFCQGDSGGPLVCKGVPVGIVSFNLKDCSYNNGKGFPNVYTDISPFLSWINDILNRGDC
ncbi:hypothetical protein NL108_005557 [Boleophthalmus pectinirostris]|uniref:duodenase-1-like n=1 Tax=Boleophthalmus pectinirostris TaxID=150288 RepID=UPI002432EAD3|nr:duodenase-1-like [Boleophthalmus pectinirostris]KAJ0065073.1 hypothetical protein NL108_005557 [Boleophthalmus pectinirostris]